MLGEDAPQVGRAGFGAAVGLLARPPFEFFFAHGQASGVSTGVENRHGLATWQRLECFPLLPLLGSGPYLLDQALNLAGGHHDASGLAQVLLGLLVTGLIGSFQAP